MIIIRTFLCTIEIKSELEKYKTLSAHSEPFHFLIKMYENKQTEVTYTASAIKYISAKLDGYYIILCMLVLSLNSQKL